MVKFRALLWVNLRAMLCSFRVGRGKKTRSASGAGALVLMAALACYLSCIYSFTFATQLAQVNMLSLLMLIMPLMAVVMGIFFTLFAAQGVVFGGKDNDLMLALPISPFSLMLSRTLALYLENLVFCLFVMIPAGAAYLINGGQAGLWFWVGLLPGTLLLALLPTLLALICGFVLAWLSSKFTRRALLSTLLYFAFFLLLMVGVFQLNGLMLNLASYAAGIQAGFAGWGLPFLLFQGAVCGGDLPALLALLALCLLPFLAVVWLFGRQYKGLVTGLTARGARSDYTLTRLSAGSRRLALLKKEAGRFFGTPIYLFNAGFGLVLMLVGAIASLVMRGRLLALLDFPGLSALPIAPLLAAILAFLASTVAITASSISLEGKTLWILKEAPVSVDGLFAVKVGFQLLLVLPCLLISTLCMGFALSLPLGQLLLVFLSTGASSVLTALFGLFVNLCFPKLDAPNDTVVVKQSAAAMLATFGSMLLAALGVGVYLLSWPALGISGALVLCTLLFAAGSVVLLLLLRTKGAGIFATL